MKYRITRKIVLDITLDSSESIMFSQGGKHKINLDSRCLHIYDIDGDPENVELEIIVQMDKNDKGRHDFITEEAKKHREYWDKVNNEN